MVLEGAWHSVLVVDLLRVGPPNRTPAILQRLTYLCRFLVFPASFPTASNPTQNPNNTLSIVAVILLALGYSLSVALWFICTSWLFQFDVVFVYVINLKSPEIIDLLTWNSPCLTACILGSINIGISLGVYAPTPIYWGPTPVAALTLGLLSSFIYTGISIFTYRKISYVRSKDKTSARHGSETLTLLPEDELQRQQLLRLLLQKENERTSPVTSSSTFRIDIPDNAIASHRGNFASYVDNPELSYLAAPSATYESRGRGTTPLPIDDQFNLARGNIHEPIDRRQQALEAARQRTAANNAQRSRDSSIGGPPVIVNTRSAGDEISNIPLSERHPLERNDFVRGRNSKEENEIYRDGVYRRDSGDYDDDEEEDYEEGPTYEIIEGERIQVDLERGFRRPGELDGNPTQRRELEGRGAPGPSGSSPGQHFKPSPQEWATM